MLTCVQGRNKKEKEATLALHLRSENGHKNCWAEDGDIKAAADYLQIPILVEWLEINQDGHETDVTWVIDPETFKDEEE